MSPRNTKNILRRYNAKVIASSDRKGGKWTIMAVTSSHSLEAAWWFFSAFEHCATRSDEIDDTSSAVTSQRQWNVSDARLPSISKHLRRTTAPSFTPTRAIVVQGPLDDDSYAAETASLDRDPLLIHDVSILPSELTDVVRYAEYRDTREPPIVWFNIRQRLWIVVGGFPWFPSVWNRSSQDFTTFWTTILLLVIWIRSLPLNWGIRGWN